MKENKHTLMQLKEILLDFAVRASRDGASEIEIQALPEVAKALVELSKSIMFIEDLRLEPPSDGNHKDYPVVCGLFWWGCLGLSVVALILACIGIIF